MDTDTPRDRAMTLRVVALSGIVAPQELNAAVTTRMLMETTFTRDGLDGGTLTLPGSFTTTPAGGNTDTPVTLWLRADIAARVNAPAAALDRVVTFRFLRHQHATARVFLPLRCSDRASGCLSVDGDQCTVSIRCREQGATCGDQGECVRPEVVVTPPDAGAESIDVPSVAFDVTSGRVEDAPTDVQDASDDRPTVDTPAALDAPTPAMDATDASDIVPAPPPTDAMDVAAIQDIPTIDQPNADSPDTSIMLSAPRPIFPLSTGSVNTRVPQLRWIRPAGVPEGYVTLCRDRACTMVITTLSGVDGAMVGVPLPPGWVYWNIRGKNGVFIGNTTSPTWQFYVHPSPMGVPNSSWSAPFDCNGDLFADIAIGVPGANGNGAVYVILGSAMGPIAAMTTLTAPPGSVAFGTAVANAGDYNGDGYSDLLVGDPQAVSMGAVRAGRLSLFLGGPMGLNPSPINQEWSSANTEFANSVAGAGDVNGDGFSDIIVGWHRSTQFAQANAGSAHIYLGNSMGTITRQPAANFTSFIPSEDMGYSVAALGDINRDGYADTAFSIYNATPSGLVGGGRLAIVLGDRDAAALRPNNIIDGTSAGAHFGAGISSAGDMDGDQYSDILVGIPGSNAGGAGSGRVELFMGSGAGLVMPPRSFVNGSMAGQALGSSVALVGDINGDGYSDVAIGAPESAGTQGQFAVYLGQLGAMLTGGIPGMHTLTDGDRIGSAIAGGGDVNNDGFAELVVSAPTAQFGAAMPSGYVNIYRWPGMPAALPNTRLRSGAMAQRLGFSLGM